MAEGGSDYGEFDPLITKDDDNKQEAETTQPFQPAHWSTPHHRGDEDVYDEAREIRAAFLYC